MLKNLKYLVVASVLLWSCQLTSVLALSFNPYPTGTLVNDSGTIYFISGNEKVPFTSWQAFSGLGYSLQNVVQGDLTNYPLVQGYTLNTANAAHPWGSWIIYQGTVYYVSQGGLIGVPSAQVFTSNGGDWQYIVRANQYDVQALSENPNQPVLQMNDPRVVSSTTYSGGGSTGNLSVSVSSLSFTVAGVGSGPTSTQSFSIDPVSSTTSWTAQAELGSIPGLNIFYGNALGGVVSGTGYASVGVSILGPFTAGTFTGTVLVTSDGQSQTVSVTLTVTSSSATTNASGSLAQSTLLATPQALSILNNGSLTQVIISGGTLPYNIETAPNSAIASVYVVNSSLVVSGSGAGTTSVVVQDSSSPANTVTIPITVTSSSATTTSVPLGVCSYPGLGFQPQANTVQSVCVTSGGTWTVNPPTSSNLSFTPASISIVAGDSGASAIVTGGTPPYQFVVPQGTADPRMMGSWLQFSFNRSTLGVTGTGPGTASITIQDSSSPPKTVTIPITVLPSTTPMGTCTYLTPTNYVSTSVEQSGCVAPGETWTANK